jgi:hypothetical protein
MKEITLSLVAIAALCLGGCDRTERPADADKDKDEYKDKDEDDPGTPNRRAEPSNDAARREVGQTTPGTPAAQGSQTRAEFVAASRRRLEQLERELQQLEARSRKSGKELRAEIRAEKNKLDADLDRMGEESEQVWGDMKGGFADALERLETQLQQVRKDLDPDA